MPPSNVQEVSQGDIFYMLRNYEYTIDATSDAGGHPETFGYEAGNGIISAKKMLAWVAANCHETCHVGENLIRAKTNKKKWRRQVSEWSKISKAVGLIGWWIIDEMLTTHIS